MAETKMQRKIYFIGAGVLAATAIFAVAQRASTLHPQSLGTPANVTMIPHLELMLRYDKALPVEAWDAS